MKFSFLIALLTTPTQVVMNETPIPNDALIAHIEAFEKRFFKIYGILIFQSDKEELFIFSPIDKALLVTIPKSITKDNLCESKIWAALLFYGLKMRYPDVDDEKIFRSHQMRLVNPVHCRKFRYGI